MVFCRVKHSSECVPVQGEANFLIFYIFYQKAIIKISCLPAAGILRLSKVLLSFSKLDKLQDEHN